MPSSASFNASLNDLVIAELPTLVGSGRQAFLRSLSQHERLIAIETSLPPDALLVEKFGGHEAMNHLFRFEVDCIATSAHYALTGIVGEQVSLRIRLADGSRRALHGLVEAVSNLGSDGALARYRLTLAPWMHALTQRHDSYVFQDKTVLEIVDEILRDYPASCYRFQVATPLPRRSLAIQYRESDYAFVARLLAEEGLNFFFEHLDDDVATTADDGRARARHRLVIFDDNAALQPCSQSAIRFHRADVAEATDAITLFQEQHRVRPNTVTLSSWDYKTAAAPAAAQTAAARIGEAPPLETYEGGGAYRYTDRAECERIARARVESLALDHERMHGEGSVRALAVGSWFSLAEHASADGDYIALEIAHFGANNLGGVDASNDGEAEHGTYRNRFSCTPRAIPVRPPYWLPKPAAPGPQVALVVGLDGEPISTERDHRIKVQFPWQRGERAAPGQGLHRATSNAPGNLAAGTWVRVAEPGAGANWGSNFVPRIGQEVMVAFVAGDIDRPVVTGQLYNGPDAPPYHGADNHPGALAGIRSQELAGGGYSHWTFDDTPGQLRQSLYSSYAGTQLHLGYLIRQNDNQRSRYRGQGFELATDAWSTLRARQGMFVSTVQRPQAISTQLDTREAQGKLRAAEELAKTLSDAAVQHQAHGLSTPQGVAAMRNTANDKTEADCGSAPAFAQPLALLDSAAGIATATPASSVAYGGQDLTITSATALRATAGQTASVVSGKSVSLFTHHGGAKLIAAQQAISVRAHTAATDAIAEQAVTLTSTAGNIKVQAKQEILLASGGGYVRLAGGNVDIHCPGAVSVKGGSHEFTGGGSKPARLPVLPGSTVSTAGIQSEIKTDPALGSFLLNDVTAWWHGKADAGTVASMAGKQVTDALLPNRAAANHRGPATLADDAAGMGKEAWNTAVNLAQGLVHATPLLRAVSALNGTSEALKSAQLAIPESQAYGANVVDKANLFLGGVAGGADAAAVADARAAEVVGASSTRTLAYKPTSGVLLQTQEGKTTTVLGSYNNDMRSVVDELGNVKDTDFGPRVGDFNVLNVPDELYISPQQFWADHNQPWLSNVIDRGDNVLMATQPAFDVTDSRTGFSVLVRPNSTTGKMELSGFGREYLMMRRAGYVYKDGAMVK